MNKLKKRSAFTLVEIVIAMMIFAVLTLGFYSAMLSIYSNSKTEFYIGKKIFSGVESLERSASLLHDRELRTGQKLDSLSRHAIVSNVLNTQGDLRYVKEFEVFSGTPYKTKVDGHFLTRQILVGETLNGEESTLTPQQEKTLPRDSNQANYFVYFIPNDEKKELEIPEYEYVKILEKRSSADEGYAVDYTYLNKIKNGKVLLGASKITEETKKFFYFEKYMWEFSAQKSKGSIFYKPFNSIKGAVNPVKPEFVEKAKKGDNYVDGASIRLDYDRMDLRYPDSSDFLDMKRYHKYYKEYSEKIDHDGFLRFSLEPITKSLVKLSPIKTPAIWVIALPITDNMLFHFDMALTQPSSFVKVGDMFVEEADSIRDLSTSIHGDWHLKRSFKSVDPTKTVKVYNEDKKFGKYVKLSSGDDLIFDSVRDLGEESDFSIFMVVDVKDAAAGTVLKRKVTDPSKPYPFKINYEGGHRFKLLLDPHREMKNNLITGDTSRDTHIIFLKVYDYRKTALSSEYVYYFMTVDNYRFDVTSNDFAGYAYKSSENIRAPLILGGANEMKVKEIICYKDAPYSTYKGDYEAKNKAIYEYLYNKHIAP